MFSTYSFCACTRNINEQVQWLVDGDALEGPTGCQIAQRNFQHRSPLALAARQGHAPVYRFLLVRGTLLPLRACLVAT